MKKTRFIPYGYTVCDGRTIIDRCEAEVIRDIFKEYITGASLKDIAGDLTERKVPYTEKTDSWDKARVARIIDNAKYLGRGEYDPIIDEGTFERAAACKAARQRNTVERESEAIAILRDRIRCEDCGYPMVRKICSKRQIKESWSCTNAECGCRVRISDGELLSKCTILMNRITENTELMIPRGKPKKSESFLVQKYQQEMEAELERENPSEEYIIARIGDIASQLYKETQAKAMITAQIARKRALLMHPQENFNSEYFQDLIAYISMDRTGRITLHTKTETEISEGE